MKKEQGKVLNRNKSEKSKEAGSKGENSESSKESEWIPLTEAQKCDSTW